MNDREARRRSPRLARFEKWALGLLSAALAFQVFLIALSDVRFSIPVFILDQAKTQAANQGLAFEAKEASFTLNGRILLTDVRIHADHGNLPPLAFARRISAKMNYFSFLSGRFLPAGASFEGAWILADEQSEAPALENLFGHAEKSGDKLLFHAGTQIGSAKIDLRGSWSPKKSIKPKTGGKAFRSPFLRKDFPSLRQQALDHANRAKAWLAHCRNPTLRAHLTLGRTNGLNLLAHSDSFSHPLFTTGELQGSATFLNGADSSIVGDLELDVFGWKRPGADTNASFSHANLKARGFGRTPDGNVTAPTLLGRVNGLRVEGKLQGSLPSLYLNAAPTNDPRKALLFAGMGTGASSICLSGTALPFESSSDLSLRLSLNPEDFDSPTLSDWRVRNLLRATSPVRGEIGPIRLENAKFLGAPFHLNATGLVIRGSEPATYRLQGFFTPSGDLRIPRAYGKLGQSEVRGSFEQNFAENLDYRFLLEGACLPTELNPWLRSWWERIWTDFSFGDEPPYGDFEIKGRWKTRGSRTRVFGSTSFSDVTYRDLPVETGGLNVIVTPENTRLARIRLTPPKGEVEGQLSFPRYRSGLPLALRFNFRGDLNPTQCKRVFGKTAEEALSRFETNSTIRAAASGSVLLTRPSSPAERALTRFQVEANCSSPIRYSGLPLDNLSLRLDAGHDESLISPLRFKLAEGDGNGTLLFRHDGNGTLLNLDLAIRNANRAGFTRALSLSSAFSDSPQEANQSEEAPSPVEGENGILNVSLQARGNPAELWGFEGNGSLEVNDPELRRIPLFGPLSTLLKESPVPLPSGFRFKRLRAPFRLQGEFAHFQNLELSGLASLLVASGKVNLAVNELDFDARLYALGGIPIPLLDKIIQLVDPLSAIANLKISGSFDQPDWKAKFSPKGGPFKLLAPKSGQTESSGSQSKF